MALSAHAVAFTRNAHCTRDILSSDGAPRYAAARMSAPEFQESQLLKRVGFRHGFFTRRGGVSLGAYGSLNFSYAVGDKEDAVTQNFSRASVTLGVPPERICFLSQVHGGSVTELMGTENHWSTRHIEGDALMSTAPELACAVRTADCVPVLLADPHTGIVAAVHAGWRGIELNIVGATVSKLRERGASRDLVAAIGPHISVQAFEVSEDVAERLALVSPAEAIRRDLGEKPHVDLRLIARSQLEQAGLSQSAIDDVPGCTVQDPDSYFSFRRDGKASGRHLHAIVARRTSRQF